MASFAGHRLLTVHQSIFFIGPHQMHEMRTIAFDDPVECLPRGFTQFCCVNTAERIEIMLGLDSWGPSKHCVRLGGPGFSEFDAAFAQFLWLLLYYFRPVFTEQEETRMHLDDVNASASETQGVHGVCLLNAPYSCRPWGPNIITLPLRKIFFCLRPCSTL